MPPAPPPAVFVKDLGDVLHLIGGTVAALLIFFNPGFMLINAAIVKHSTSELDQLQQHSDDTVRAPFRAVLDRHLNPRGVPISEDPCTQSASPRPS